MRISDWSSDVCSSDLCAQAPQRPTQPKNPLWTGHRRGEFPRPPLPLCPCLSCQVYRKPGAHIYSDVLNRAGSLLQYPDQDFDPVSAIQHCCLYRRLRSEEHTSELQSLMRISYAVFCLKKKK